MEDLSDTMNEWATHQTPLICAVMNTTGPVLEMGSGHYSTPILHEVCKAQNRHLTTVDNNKEWIDQFSDLSSANHRILYTEDWDAVEGEYDVIFIDHAPEERRKVDIEKFKSKCKIMVVHDYLQDNVYKHHAIMDTFKYKSVYTRYKRHTVLLSDTVDVSKII